MSSEVFVNPEEDHTHCRNIDNMLMQHLKRSNQSISTSEFSTQVNMDEENLKYLDNPDKKKSKKKEYKRKKRQKKKVEEESARNKLSIIINQIYKCTTNFEENRDIIEQILIQLIRGEKFHAFLNDIIKQNIKIMQDDIILFMQSIITDNQLEKSPDDQDFYLKMIDYLYSQYCKIIQSSQEIQKILNRFMCINSNSKQHQNDEYGLDRSIFKFMIQSDSTIKDVVRICHGKIHPQHKQHIEKIKQLSRMVNRFHIDCDHQQFYQQVTQRSTSVDQQQQQRVGKRRKKRKHRQSDFRSSIQDVIRRLDQMEIYDEDRSLCQATQQWAIGLKKKFDKRLSCEVSDSWASSLRQKYEKN